MVVQITGSVLFHAPSPVERQNRGLWTFSLPLFSSPAGGDIHNDLQKKKKTTNTTTKSNPPSSHGSYFILGFYILPRCRRLRLRVEDVDGKWRNSVIAGGRQLWAVAACAVGVEVGGFGCCWRRLRKRAVAGGGSAVIFGKDWLSWV